MTLEPLFQRLYFAKSHAQESCGYLFVQQSVVCVVVEYHGIPLHHVFVLRLALGIPELLSEVGSPVHVWTPRQRDTFGIGRKRLESRYEG